jgi:hypothetical protein
LGCERAKSNRRFLLHRLRLLVGQADHQAVAGAQRKDTISFDHRGEDPMFRFGRVAIFALAILVLTASAQAGTIIKLSLGTDALADVEFSGGASGVFGTMDDGNAATNGDQNTAIEFGDFLDGSQADVQTTTASFTLDNLAASGAPSTFGPLVIQNFTGGTLSLYNPANVLLLSGTLANSALTGPIGPPATGALFTTSFATVTGGTLQPQIVANSLTVSMSFSDINSGAGFTLGGGPSPVLTAFQADATLSIAGQQIPEPVAAILIAVASAGLVTLTSRHRPLRS